MKKLILLGCTTAVFLTGSTSISMADYHHDKRGWYDEHHHRHSFVSYHNHRGYWNRQSDSGPWVFVNID